MSPQQCQQFFARLQAVNPHPRTELCYHNPFQLLLAVMLSAQSTDRQVNQVTQALFTQVQGPADVLALGLPALESALRQLGLFRTKARHVYATAQRLEQHHGGQVPGTRQALQALPGVGRKTANVVLNIAFGQPTLAVDTHIFRVANRTGLAPGNTVLAVEQALLRVVPAAFLPQAHHWLILHGRYICRARKPDCPACPVMDLCASAGLDV